MHGWTYVMLSCAIQPMRDVPEKTNNLLVLKFSCNVITHNKIWVKLNSTQLSSQIVCVYIRTFRIRFIFIFFRSLCSIKLRGCLRKHPLFQFLFLLLLLLLLSFLLGKCLPCTNFVLSSFLYPKVDMRPPPPWEQLTLYVQTTYFSSALQIPWRKKKIYISGNLVAANSVRQ